MTQDPKPIVVIKVDQDKILGMVGRRVDLIDIDNSFSLRLPDYHAIVVPFGQSTDDLYEPIRLEVFYPKDFKEIEFQELKKQIQAQINSYISEAKPS